MNDRKMNDLIEQSRSYNNESQVVDEKFDMVVGFNIGQEEYGIDIMLIREIIRNPNVTIVPNAQKYLEGVINLRGDVVPLIDLRKKFNMKSIKRGKSSRTIVVEINDKVVGIVVDKVTEVVKIPEKNIEPPPKMAGAIQKEFIKTVGKLPGRLVIILDMKKIIAKK